MAQEARINPGVTERERFPVDPHRTVLQRTDQFFRSVHQPEQIAAVVEPHPVRHGDEDLKRCVARPRAHACERRIDPCTAVFKRDDGIRNAEGQIVMGVNACFGFRFQHIVERLEPVGDVLHQQRAAGIRHVDAVRPVLFHQQRLLGQFIRRVHMRHHQKTGDIHAQVAGIFDVLFGDVGLGTMRRHANGPRTCFVRFAQIFYCADPRQQQRCQLGVLQNAGRGFDIVEVGFLGKTVVERHASQSVAMGDFDGGHFGVVQCLAYRLDMIETVLMANGVHSVTKRDVLHIDFFLCVDGHGCAPKRSPCGVLSRVPRSEARRKS